MILFIPLPRFGSLGTCILFCFRFLFHFFAFVMHWYSITTCDSQAKLCTLETPKDVFICVLWFFMWRMANNNYYYKWLDSVPRKMNAFPSQFTIHIFVLCQWLKGRKKRLCKIQKISTKKPPIERQRVKAKETIEEIEESFSLKGQIKKSKWKKKLLKWQCDEKISIFYHFWFSWKIQFSFSREFLGFAVSNGCPQSRIIFGVCN